eukprot:GHVU01084955.1.p1 GENE.GHVU01084955.1~~GHVU01084955.1.p1  ORF type:complete len:102 (-),score=5.25 GHVU01084955.1:310-615(-)
MMATYCLMMALIMTTCNGDEPLFVEWPRWHRKEIDVLGANSCPAVVAVIVVPDGGQTCCPGLQRRMLESTTDHGMKPHYPAEDLANFFFPWNDRMRKGSVL